MDYSKMYKQKVKKVRDPNLPPRPNLMSHDKTIRGMNANFEMSQRLAHQQQVKINSLEAEIRRINNRLETLTAYLNKK
jgi:hypothetical protein